MLVGVCSDDGYIIGDSGAGRWRWKRQSCHTVRRSLLPRSLLPVPLAGRQGLGFN